ncbi:MAG: fucose isomerase [Candidatus Hodarchaeota archaeon]
MRNIIIPFFSPISSESIQAEILSQLALNEEQILSKENYFLGFHPIAGNRYYLFVGTGGTENDIKEFIERSKLEPPIILLSYNANNSLPAAMELRSYLNSTNIDANIVHGALEELSQLLHKWNGFVQIKRKLADCRMGLIGNPSEWLIASEVDEDEIRKIWGTEIIHIPIEELIDLENTQLTDKILKYNEKFLKLANEYEVPPSEVEDAALVIEKLLQLIQEYNLNVLTIKCFDLLLKSSITSCYAMSYLNDQGIITGCEGDIPSTFTMFLLNILTGQTPFMANVTHVDSQKNIIYLAHCTVALGVLETYSITTHFESRKSVAIRGQFKTPQDVTILKIGGNDLTKWWTTKGKIIRNLDFTSACRTQIEISIEKPARYFLEESLANHHILVLGDHVKTINEFLNFVLNKL